MLQDDYALEIDHLAIGLTKPPVKFGVPLVAFYVNCMLCILGWMLIENIVHGGFATALAFLVLFLLIHFTMVIVCLRDAFGLRIAGLKFIFFPRNKTCVFWNNTDSYAP